MDEEVYYRCTSCKYAFIKNKGELCENCKRIASSEEFIETNCVGQQITRSKYNYMFLSLLREDVQEQIKNLGMADRGDLSMAIKILTQRMDEIRKLAQQESE